MIRLSVGTLVLALGCASNPSAPATEDAPGAKLRRVLREANAHELESSETTRLAAEHHAHQQSSESEEMLRAVLRARIAGLDPDARTLNRDSSSLRSIAAEAGFSGPVALVGFVRQLDLRQVDHAAKRFLTDSESLYLATIDRLGARTPLSVKWILKNAAAPAQPRGWPTVEPHYVSSLLLWRASARESFWSGEKDATARARRSQLESFLHQRVDAALARFEIAWLDRSRGEAGPLYREHVANHLRSDTEALEFVALIGEWGQASERFCAVHPITALEEALTEQYGETWWSTTDAARALHAEWSATRLASPTDGEHLSAERRLGGIAQTLAEP